MLDRIQELLRVREISASQFADTIGVSRPVVSHILSGRNKPSLEVVQKITAAFPDLSLSWLLNGNGPMLERPAAQVAAKPSAAPKPPVPPVEPVSQPAPVSPVAPSPPAVAPVAPATAPAPAVPADLPTEAPKMATQARSDSSAPVAAPPSPAPAGADIAYALAEPGKRIRRIVLFYQDGTFADFQPEPGA